VRAAGGGELAAVDSGDVRDISPVQAGRRNAYEGRVLAIVRAGTAAGTAAGLGSGVVGTREHPASTASAAAALQRRTHRAINIGCATFRAWAGCPFAPPPVARP